MQSTSRLRLLLVEDDELFRLGLQVRLQREGDLEIIAEAEDGESAVELTHQYQPDVVVLDVGLPGIGGIEACRQITENNPDIPVLILTSHSQKALIERLIEAGAKGYCLKGIAPETLVLAIRSLVAGASWWDPTATQHIKENFSNPTPPLTPPELVANPLTKREQEILALVAVGKSNQEIASILFIALGTVRVHVHAILHKLEVRDRTQAAVLAIQNGLIDSDSRL